MGQAEIEKSVTNYSDFVIFYLFDMFFKGSLEWK